MNGKDLMNGLNHIDDTYLEEAKRPVSAKKIWLKWGVTAACLCLVVAGALTFGLLNPPATNAPQTEIQANTQPGNPMANQSGEGSQVQTGTSPEDSTTEIGQIPIETLDDPPGFFGEDPVDPIDGSEPDGYAFKAQEVRTNRNNAINRAYPIVTVIRSQEELASYYETNVANFRLEGEFAELIKAYDDAFFAKQDLILVVVEEHSGSVRHEITGFRPCDNGEGDWQITCKRKVPEIGTSDMAYWHILVEVEKGLIGPYETVVFKSDGGMPTIQDQYQTH